MEHDTLLGKYVFFSNDEYWKSGKVTKWLGDGAFIVAWDPTVYKFPIEALHHTMHCAMEGGWQFFDNREDMQHYIDWIEETPEDNDKKVVKLVKNDDHSQKTGE